MTTTQLLGNRYELTNTLGEGGMGAVYRAKDRLTGQVVALKRVRRDVPQETGTPDHAYRLALAREFRTMASLRHPHIVSVLDYGFDQSGMPYFTMTLLHEALPITDAMQGQNDPVKLLIQTLQALDYLHRRGVIHRDLKPANILVDQHNMVRLVDFGIATKLDEIDQDEIQGTIAYMAPEALQSGDIGIASDLYSLGVIAYELFTKQPLFDEGLSNQLINDILYEIPDLEAIPENFQELLASLLEKDPDLRPFSASDTLLELCEAADILEPPETVELRESYLQASAFVGRDTEMQSLQDALGDLLAGRGSAWLIGGESGVGKSRLVDEFRTLAMVEGMLVLRGQAVSGGGMALQPWRDPLRRLALASDLTTLEAGTLREIIPDIETLLGYDHLPDPPELTSEAEQQRLRNTIIELFFRQQQPIVLVLEDLQWSPDSLNLLAEIIKTIETTNLMVIGSYRSDEQPGLPEYLPGMQHMKLERFSTHTIANLTKAMLGVEAASNQDLLDLLHRETEGNAFFLVEVVRALAEEAGNLRQIGLHIPESVVAGGVDAVIARRLERISEKNRPLLHVAALAGREITPEVLQWVQSKDTSYQQMTFDEWLLSGVNAAILEVQDEVWRFTHDKLRENLVAAIEKDKKHHLHKQIAEALEAVYEKPDDHAAMLAFHWRAARQYDKEAHYLKVVGKRQLETSSFQQALETFQRYMKLSHSFHDPETLYYIARAHNGLGNNEVSIVHLRRAMNEAVKQPHNGLMARIESRLANILWRLGRYDQAQENAQAALELAEKAGERLVHADALATVGIITAITSTPADSQAYFERSLAIYESEGYRKGMADTYNNMGINAVEMGKIQVGSDYYASSAMLCEQIGDRLGWLIANNNIAELHLIQGNYAEAEALYDQSRELARKIGAQYYYAIATQQMAIALRVQGYFEMCEEYIIESNKIWQMTGTRQEQTLGYIIYSQLRCSQGRYDDAIELSRRAANLARNLIENRTTAYGYLALARVELLRPNYHHAQQYADRAINAAQEIGVRHVLANALLVKAHSALFNREYETATSFYEQAAEITQALSMQAKGLEAELGQAYLMALQGDHSQLKRVQVQVDMLVDVDVHQIFRALDDHLQTIQSN